jgi:hypothetical protein
MSSKSLKNFVADFTNPKGNLGDFQHAARLFVDDNLRLAPKTKFNFYVVFTIDRAALPMLVLMNVIVMRLIC